MSNADDIKKISTSIEERYQRNIDFFKNNMDTIHDLIQNTDPIVNLTYNTLEKKLERKNEDGSLYYKEGALAYAIQEVKNFEAKGNTIDYRPSPAEINPSHLIKKKSFYDTSLLYAKEYLKNQVSKPLHSGLIIFGTGVGYHLEILCNKNNHHYYTIIETDFNKFHETLYFINWESILSNLPQNKRLTLMVKDPNMTDEDFYHSIFYQCYKLFPSINVSTIIYSHDHLRNEENFEEVRRAIKDFNNISRVATERAGPDCQRLLNSNKNCQARHSIINLDETEILHSDSKIAIIGAGPSLDDYIDIIKEHQDKMIIVSAGSSLKSLLENGIKPDIHFELEYLNLATRLLKFTDTENSLSNIDLICSAESNPGFLEFFKSSKMFIQETSELAKTLDKKYILKNGGLTCTNGAAALLSRLCDNDIIFFGLDFAHTHGEHHSKHNITNENQVPEDLTVLKTTGIELKNGAHIEVEGINGETLLTTPALFSARKLIEKLCKANENNYFNCSNGAKINGAKHLDKNNAHDYLSMSTSNIKEIKYKELILSPDILSKYTKDVFRVTFQICREVLLEVKKMKDLEQIDCCIKISEMITKIYTHFGHASGQFRNIMGFNRTPLLLLYSVINFSQEEKYQEIIEQWIVDYTDFIEFTSNLINEKLESEDYSIYDDWLDNH